MLLVMIGRALGECSFTVNESGLPNPSQGG
jgi:hypothetical protein